MMFSSTAARRSIPGTRRLSPSRKNDTLAHGLGWLSVGLGLAELIAPRKVSRIAGLGRNGTMVLRALGLREILSGLGIFAGPGPRRAWVWSRVGGDAMDLALLGTAFALGATKARNRFLITTGAIAGVTLVDFLTARRMSQRPDEIPEIVSFQESILVSKSPGEVYRFWRDFTNLAQFMKHVERVTPIDERRSHWVIRAPGGMRFEWDAEITEDIPDTLIAWQTTGDADLENSGIVQFEEAPGGRGTLVRIAMAFRPPGGRASGILSRFLGKVPSKSLHGDLLRLRQVIEAGEIATTRGQPAGRSRSLSVRYDLPVQA